MGIKSGVQWCDSSVNPTAGCDGCELLTSKVRACYAEAMHSRFQSECSVAYPQPFDQPREMPGRMAKAAAWSDLRGAKRPHKPWLDGLPRVIFTGDMADVLSRAITFEYIREEILGAINSPNGRRHFWILVTKRPKRLAEFSLWLAGKHNEWLPDNLMVMTSVTTQATAWRIDALLNVPCKWRGVSIEPLLGPINLHLTLTAADKAEEERLGYLVIPGCPTTCGAMLDWIIVGCESNGARVGRLIANGDRLPESVWLNQASFLARQTRAANVAFFAKQIPRGGRVLHAEPGNENEFPEALRAREMPAIGEEAK